MKAKEGVDSPVERLRPSVLLFIDMDTLHSAGYARKEK